MKRRTLTLTRSTVGDFFDDKPAAPTSTYVPRGTWEGTFPLSVDPNAGATGVYTDENLVNWMVAPVVADTDAMDALVQATTGHSWKAWIDGEDGPAVYQTPSGTEQVPLLDGQPASLDAVKAIDAWIAARGKSNPDFAKNKVLVQKPSGGEATLTVTGSLSWWPFIIAALVAYNLDKVERRARRRS